MSEYETGHGGVLNDITGHFARQEFSVNNQAIEGRC